MNSGRRSFLKFLGILPFVGCLAKLSEGTKLPDPTAIGRDWRVKHRFETSLAGARRFPTEAELNKHIGGFYKKYGPNPHYLDEWVAEADDAMWKPISLGERT